MLIGERPGPQLARQPRHLPHLAAAARPQRRRAQLHLQHPPRRPWLRRRGATGCWWLCRRGAAAAADRGAAQGPQRRGAAPDAGAGAEPAVPRGAAPEPAQPSLRHADRERPALSADAGQDRSRSRGRHRATAHQRDGLLHVRVEVAVVVQVRQPRPAASGAPLPAAGSIAAAHGSRSPGLRTAVRCRPRRWRSPPSAAGGARRARPSTRGPPGWPTSGSSPRWPG